MQEAIILVLTHVRMVWRFRWLALVVASLVCVVGWTNVVMKRNVYSASTRVFLDTRSMLRPLLKGLAVDPGTQSAVNMVQRLLLIRSNLEVIARKTDMDLKAKTPAQFDGMLNRLRSRIRISRSKGNDIFRIAFSDQDPEHATRVVEAILNLFVERSLGETRKDVGSTKQFLDRQIAEYEARLTAAENRLKEFKRRNVGMMPSAGSGFFSRLQKMKSKLAGARLALDEATRRRDEYRRQLDGVEMLFETEVVAKPRRRPHPLDKRIAALEQQIDKLQVKYTDKHPDVAGALARLAALESKREATPLPEQPASPASETVTRQNPMGAQLELALHKTEADVAGLTARVEEFERRAAALAEQVNTIPRIEAELKRLNRDYGLDKRNYDELVKRRESLNMSEKASQSGEAVQFNVIAPPRVPRNPSGPNRPLLSAMVLGAGLAVGLGLAWLVAMLRPAFYNRDEIETALEIPVIGSVTRTWTRGEVLRRRMEVTSFVAGCLFLVASFSGLQFAERNNKQLMNQVRDNKVLQQVVRRVRNLV